MPLMFLDKALFVGFYLLIHAWDNRSDVLGLGA